MQNWRKELHRKISEAISGYDPVHIEAFMRLRHGPGSYDSMADHQFAEAVREASSRVDEVGFSESERFARVCGLRDEETAQNPDIKEGNYYVTIRRDSSYALLAGPFANDHKTALSFVVRARLLAEKHWPETVFDGIGTARFPLTFTAPGVLNEELGLAASPSPSESNADRLWKLLKDDHYGPQIFRSGISGNPFHVFLRVEDKYGVALDSYSIWPDGSEHIQGRFDAEDLSKTDDSEFCALGSPVDLDRVPSPVKEKILDLLGEASLDSSHGEVFSPHP